MGQVALQCQGGRNGTTELEGLITPSPSPHPSKQPAVPEQVSHGGGALVHGGNRLEGFGVALETKQNQAADNLCVESVGKALMKQVGVGLRQGQDVCWSLLA